MIDRRVSSVSKGPAPSRNSSLKKPRSSNIGGARGLLQKSPLSPPSLLTAHLSLPSPPQSRNSSPQGSYATSATTFEDGEDGRTDGKGHKDGKGNVIVSVRVRPDAGTKDNKHDPEWEVNNKQALIAYKGKEGGDYIYGTVAQRGGA
jgi:centromeric protein E